MAEGPRSGERDEIRVYKRGSAQPVVARMDEADAERLLGGQMQRAGVDSEGRHRPHRLPRRPTRTRLRREGLDPNPAANQVDSL